MDELIIHFQVADPARREAFEAAVRKAVNEVAKEQGLEHCDVRLLPGWNEISDDEALCDIPVSNRVLLSDPNLRPSSDHRNASPG